MGLRKAALGNWEWVERERLRGSHALGWGEGTVVLDCELPQGRNHSCGGPPGPGEHGVGAR